MRQHKLLLYREEGRVRPFMIMQTSDTQQTQSKAPDRFEASSRTQGFQEGFGKYIDGEIKGGMIDVWKESL